MGALGVPFYILTGAPGSGKTAVLRLLETLGYAVVEEAATDVIALGQAMGRAEPTAARRIGFADSLAFEKLHEEVYRDLGFDLTDVPAGPLAGRAEVIRRAL